MDITTASTWLEIDLLAIRENVSLLSRLVGTPLMGIVKGNGYGHGLVAAGRAALEGGATCLGLARLEEAQLLHDAGITCPILVMTDVHPGRAAEAAAAGATLTAHHPDQARALSEEACRAGVSVPVHAKINTGMNRLGVMAAEGLDFIRLLTSLPGLQLTGMFTHFSTGDEYRHPSTAQQLQRFVTLLTALEAAHLRPKTVHASASAAMLYWPEARFDLCRAGIAMYGLQPSAETPLPSGFRPALSWKTRLVSIRTLLAGEGIGYNHRYVTTAEERIGVIAAGYGDGLRRKVQHIALINGQLVKVIGGMCMDQCMVNLDALPEAKVGDEVVLIGKQGNQEISAELLANNWNTTNYEVVCNLTARVPRFYKTNQEGDFYYG
jgi:alanine racemase